jgi:hypothetical protein
MGREKPSNSQPIIDEWEDMGGPQARWGWFELSLSQDVNNQHIFVVEKKVLGKRGIFTLKYNINLYMF